MSTVAITTTTSTITVTVTSVSTAYTTATSTTTINAVTVTATNTLVLPTPSGIGLNYYQYPTSLDYDEDDPGFDATAFNNPNYEQSGFLTNVNDIHSDYDDGFNDYYCTLPGQAVPIDCTELAVVMQGYIYAVFGPGTYTFSTPNTIDNALYFYTGSVAYSSYNDNNYAYNAVRAGQDDSAFFGGSTTLSLAAGQLVPVTIIFVNGGGPAAAVLDVTGPDDLQYTDTSPFFIPADPTSCPHSASPFSP